MEKDSKGENTYGESKIGWKTTSRYFRISVRDLNLVLQPSCRDLQTNCDL